MIHKLPSRLPDQAQKVFQGEIFSVYQWQQEMFDGTFATFERLQRPDSVLVIPVTVEGNLVYTRQQQPDTAEFITFPGGRVDEGEAIEDSAKRELLEETGYTYTTLELWFTHTPVSKIEWNAYFVIAKGCFNIQDPTPDAGEIITTFTEPVANFVSIVRHPQGRHQTLKNTVNELELAGRLNDVMFMLQQAYITYQLARLFRLRVKHFL